MKSVDLIDINTIAPITNNLIGMNVNVNRHLEKVLIPSELFSLPQASITKRQAYQFCENVMRKEGIDSVGLIKVEDFGLEAMGALGEGILASKTLLDAINFFRTLLPIVAHGNTAHFYQEDRGTVVFGFHTDGDKMSAADHYDLVLLLNIIRVFAGANWRPKNATLQTGYTGAFKYLDAFADCDIEFNTNLVSIKIPPSLLFLKNRFLKATETGLMNGSNSTHRLSENKPLSQVIQKILCQNMIFFKPHTINEIAEITGLNRMTIYRYLKKEGFTYSEIINRVRFEKACSLLTSADRSVKEISFELGYSSSAAFSRAFKRLAAIAPTTYQKLSVEN